MGAHPDHHDHSHHHHAAAHADAFGAKFAIATALNVAIVVLQVVFGLAANSVALLADAGHNFGDVLGLVLAWGAHVVARAPPTPRRTYGFRSASILSALVNGVTLLIATGAIAWEAVERLRAPEPVAGWTVIVVAAVGMVLNGLSAWLLTAGHKDLNVRAAFLHLVGDAAVSAVVVVTGVLIIVTPWRWLDPAASLGIAAVIAWSTVGLLRDATNLSLAAVPAGVDHEAVRGFLESLPGVDSVHDLHIWGMSTTETALTVHLVMPAGHPGDAFLLRTAHDLHARFEIGHPTIQIETDGRDCALAPDHVV